MFGKRKALTEEEINEIAEKVLEKQKNQKNTMSSEEVDELADKVLEKLKGQKSSLTAEALTEFSNKISKEILTKQSEEMMERMKAFCDEDEKIGTVGRMGFVINECNQFTREYVTQMLAKIVENK